MTKPEIDNQQVALEARQHALNEAARVAEQEIYAIEWPADRATVAVRVRDAIRRLA